MEHEIKNHEMIHREANGTEYGHSASIRCGRCPEPPEPLQPAGTWKVSAWFADPATGAIETHEMTSSPDVAAAWLRALADRAAPPRPAVRLPHDGQPGARRGRGLDALPPARH